MKRDYIDIEIAPTMEELATLKLPDPYMLDYYEGILNREIVINQDIDESMISASRLIMKWNKEDKGLDVDDRKIIKIFINTNGGCLNSIMQLISVIQLSKTPVATIGLGKCFSSGSLLLMAGTKGYRYILPTTEALIHDGSGGAVGDTGKLLDDLERTKELENRVKKYILSVTNIDENTYEMNYRRNWWMFADDIIKNSLADKVVDDLDEIL